MFEIDVSHVVMHEADEPDAVVYLLYSEALPCEYGGDIDFLPVHADTSAACDEDVSVVERVFEFGEAPIGPQGRFIEAGGHFHAEGFVRPLGIEPRDEGIEPGLLLQEVGAGRSCGFFLQSQVHALMPAILLRPAGLDALDLDAESQPPYGHFGEVVEAVGAGEGNTIVGPYRRGQAAFLEQLLEGGDRGVLAD